jgi:hypothetical protein
VTPADRTLVLAQIEDHGYGPDVPDMLGDVLMRTIIQDADAEEIIRLALYHAYWQGRHDGGDVHGEEDA